MMEIQEIGPVYTNRGSYLDCHEVLEQGQLRAIFLSKEDAQRFIRNETIRREEQGQFYMLPDYPPGIMPKVPVADMASLMEASNKLYEKLLNRCLSTMPFAGYDKTHTQIADEDLEAKIVEAMKTTTFTPPMADDLPEPDAIMETK
jgi:hypothetical protein